jgi:hypothetical protein
VDHEDTGMRAWWIATDISEASIERYHGPILRGSCLGKSVVGSTNESFVRHGGHIVAVFVEQTDYSRRNVFVGLEPHERGRGNTSSLARAAP